MNLSEYLKSLPRGGKSKFAQKISVSKSFLRQMESGYAKIPAKRAQDIEKETLGLVSKSDLRPDLWG